MVHSTEGIIACTQPLAARCGLKVLAAGGNAAVNLLTPPLRFCILITLLRMQQSLLVSEDRVFNIKY